MIRCFGIVYRFHPLFILLMLASVATGYFMELLTLFGVILIHEMGHVAAAGAAGWTVQEVELLPFGGVAKIDDHGIGTAWTEIGVALAGPLQNLWMIGLALFCRWTGIWSPEWGDYFLTVNAMIALFNLLPVLPLDGGKVTQALCSLAFPYHRALHLTALFSLAGSGVFLGAAFWTDSWGDRINILAVGGFLLASNWYGYRHLPYSFIRFLMSREADLQSRPDETRGLRGETLVVKNGTRISAAVRMLRRHRYHLIYVLTDQGKLQGILPEHRLVNRYLLEQRPDSVIAELLT